MKKAVKKGEFLFKQERGVLVYVSGLKARNIGMDSSSAVRRAQNDRMSGGASKNAPPYRTARGGGARKPRPTRHPQEAGWRRLETCATGWKPAPPVGNLRHQGVVRGGDWR